MPDLESAVTSMTSAGAEALLVRIIGGGIVKQANIRYGSRDGTNARGAPGIGGVKGRALGIGLRQTIGAVFGFTAIKRFRFQEAIVQRVVAHAIGEAMVRGSLRHASRRSGRPISQFLLRDVPYASQWISAPLRCPPTNS